MFTWIHVTFVAIYSFRSKASYVDKRLDINMLTFQHTADGTQTASYVSSQNAQDVKVKLQKKTQVTPY